MAYPEVLARMGESPQWVADLGQAYETHGPYIQTTVQQLRARAQGLLVMGPECGTSIINGVGLGFANRVRRGAVGLVGASGTGLQEVTSLIHRLGGGVSHAIGTGGRDLHADVGGITTRQAIELLAGDPGTRVLVLVSKPGADGVAREVLAAAGAAGKPAIACLLGWRGEAPAGVRVVDSLEEAARAAVEAVGLAPPALEPPKLEPRRQPWGPVLGLFTGGTLCDEARRVVGAAGGASGRGSDEESPGLESHQSDRRPGRRPASTRGTPPGGGRRRRRGGESEVNFRPLSSRAACRTRSSALCRSSGQDVPTLTRLCVRSTCFAGPAGSKV